MLFKLVCKRPRASFLRRKDLEALILKSVKTTLEIYVIEPVNVHRELRDSIHLMASSPERVLMDIWCSGCGCLWHHILCTGLFSKYYISGIFRNDSRTKGDAVMVL